MSTTTIIQLHPVNQGPCIKLGFFFFWSPYETGILNPMTKLLGLHMPGSATCPYIQIKRPGEGQRKEIYYMAQNML
jgi:hypothetical protein